MNLLQLNQLSGAALAYIFSLADTGVKSQEISLSGCFNNAEFIVLSDLTNYGVSRQLCRALSDDIFAQDTVLARIRNQEEFKFIEDLVAESFLNTFWIGIPS